MKNLLCLLFLLFSSFVYSQDTTKQNENITVEMAINAAQYHSMSISIEKTFTEGRWKFGPRVELLNLFLPQTYKGEDSTFTMNAQLRVRLAQIEYQLNDNVRIGIAPFWMLGPLPRNGFYKTPTSIYSHIQIKEGLSLETSFTNSDQEMVQISLRKVL